MGLALKKFRKQVNESAEEITKAQTETLDSAVKSVCTSVKSGLQNAKDELQEQDTICKQVIADVLGSTALPEGPTLGNEEAPESEGNAGLGRM